MPRPSILFLTNAYPDFESSYRGVFIRKMADSLVEDGYKVSVVTPKIFSASPCFEDQEGIRVYRFPFFSRNLLLIEYERIPYLRMLVYYMTGLGITFYVMIKNRCDLIHAHWAIPTGLIGVFASTILKKPLLVTIHGSDFRLAIESKGLLKRLFLYVCKKADHINCVSDFQKATLVELAIQSDKISTISMGVDDAFIRLGKEKERKSRGEPLTILSNRNLLPIYNLSMLIRAIPLVHEKAPHIRFLIAGDGAEREKLENEVKRYKVDKVVRFLGKIPHQEMPNLLDQADIYVSTSFSDGTSVSLLEAMAAGAFPIVSDIPSNREWIWDGKNGFLVPIDDEEILAKRILEALQNRKFLQEAGQTNRKIIEERAHWKKNVKRTMTVYEQYL